MLSFVSQKLMVSAWECLRDIQVDSYVHHNSNTVLLLHNFELCSSYANINALKTLD